jgi:hypothetical protein
MTLHAGVITPAGEMMSGCHCVSAVFKDLTESRSAVCRTASMSTPT